MRVFLDTNVIMDTLIPGRPSSDISSLIVSSDLSDQISISISALSVTDIVYACRKHFTKADILSRVDFFQRKWRILDLSAFSIYRALNSKCPDFEDALQIDMAEGDCDVIVTNNVKHFRGYTALEVVTPQEFLEKISR